ncbi:MAG: tetratricopeptide repeat protein [Saprospiraceae bacterium]|nr:tetratricopeptide repeat protein [Saprospiraceae bacterium]
MNIEQGNNEREIADGVIYAKKKELLSNLKKVEEDLSSKQKTKVLFLRGAAIAASIGLLVWGYWYLNTKTWEEQLVAEHLNFYEVVSSTRGPGGENSMLLVEALNFYNDGKWKRAQTAFQQLYEQSQAAEYLLYQGVCALKSGEPLTAITLLEEFTDHVEEFPILKDGAAWYLALSYLQSKQVEKSKLILNAELKNSNEFSKEVEALLRQIEDRTTN